MKAVVAAFNQEKALVGAFSVLTNLRMELFQALMETLLEMALARLQPDVMPRVPQCILMRLTPHMLHSNVLHRPRWISSIIMVPRSIQLITR